MRLGFSDGCDVQKRHHKQESLLLSHGHYKKCAFLSAWALVASKVYTKTDF
jgi:hypothetical protein